MRKYRQYIAVLAIASLAIAGCNKFENFGWLSGDTIRFGVSTQGEALTKTAYGTTTTDAGTGKRTHQMIDWKANDVIRIVCDQASTVEEGTSKTADYKTSAGTKTGTESRATLSLNSNNDKGLRWGDQNVEHKFYAVYPSPVTTGKSGDALTVGGSLTGNIPQDQPVTVSGSGPYTASVDMTNQYMVAKRTVKQKDFNNNEVFLYFTPITTAIEFTVTNKMEDNSDLVIGSIELESASHNLSGTFTTSLTGLNETGASYSNYPSVTGSSNLKKTAKVSFGTSGFTLAKDKTLTFTIFLLPVSDLNDLTFRINKTDGTYIQTALKQVVSGSTTPTFITFGRCKKHFVNGLFVNDGAKWTLAFSPNVDPWGDNTDIDQDLEDPHLGLLPSLIKWEAGETKDVPLAETTVEFDFANGSGDAVQTFPEKPQKSKTIPIKSLLNGSDQNWTIGSVSMGGTSVTSYSSEDDELIIKKSGNNLVITDNRPAVDYGDNKHWKDNSTGNDWYRAPLSGTTDLSKYQFQSGGTRTTMITANCYIVRNAGTYKIPLVYGNAIVNDNKNESSYKGTTGTYALGPFVNHLGNGIVDPFIENNLTTGNSTFRKQDRLVPSSATVLWQEYNVISTSSVSVTKTSDANNPCTSNNCGYITFTIDKDNIRQSNAIIAVMDASSNIMWSWHIWITNDPLLSEDAEQFGSYSFLPVPCLGWIEPPVYEEKKDVVVTLVQEDTEETLDITVKRPKYRCPGSGTFYQFGRKDPMPSKDDVSGTFTSETETKNLPTYQNGTSIKNGILWPHHFWCREFDRGDWIADRYDNLWTGTTSTTSLDATGGVKTVYDPCPVGYMVPRPAAYTGFCDDPDQCYDKTKWHVVNTDMSKEKGYYFGTKFFPAAGRRAYETGEIANAGENAFFWYSIPSGTAPSTNPYGRYGYGFGFNANFLWVHDYFARGNGLSISPVKQ